MAYRCTSSHQDAPEFKVSVFAQLDENDRQLLGFVQLNRGDLCGKVEKQHGMLSELWKNEVIYSFLRQK
jgi:hypothetical protein